MTSAMSRGLLFGTAAESYERFRLGYPDEVVDRTLAYAGRPVDAAVEVGAGTGKATRAFASRGIRVTALEPDLDMFTVLERETAGMPVDPVRGDLESYDGGPTDLLYAAASWHWTDPEKRCRLAADLLTQGGTLSVFGGPMQVVDPTVQADIAAAAGRDLDDPAFRDLDPDLRTGPSWLDAEIRDCGLFTDVQHHRVARDVLLPQREYVGYLSTLSAYLELSMEERQQVLRRISEVLPAQVTVDLGVGLHLARRA
jgi:SAM-dependent methyltransferase